MSDDARADARRELGTAVLLVLAGAVLLLVSTAGAWVTGVQVQPEPLPSSPVAVSGAEAAAPVRALGLVVLAAVPALAATRRHGRTAVGVLLVLAGAAAGAAAVDVLGDPGSRVEFDVDDVATTARPWLAVAGAVVTALAGAVVTARGRRWAGLGRRYEAPAARSTQPATTEPATTEPATTEPATAGGAAAGGAAPEGPELWDALDRGEDPTRG